MTASAHNARQVAVADIGGTHARFAIAHMEGGTVRSLDHMVKLRASDHPSLQTAWEQYRRDCGCDLPSDGAFAVAAPVRGPVGEEVIYFTNSSWMLRRAQVADKLGLERFTLVNDFGAVCHSVDQMGRDELAHICGPDIGLPEEGAITVIGPGTGLGVSYVTRTKHGATVFESEGGHIDFAPIDEVEDRILHSLRREHQRVSLERVVSGHGLQVIYRILCEIEEAEPRQLDDRDLWSLALGGTDAIANAALDRYCLCLGSAAGDFVLSHGAKAIVIAGGLGQRIGERLNTSGFRERMAFKGRFSTLMEATPAYRTVQAEPGLTGAAVAFAKEHLQ
ncbi:MAG: glucokinase [Pseudomonadota bacterium]